MTNEQSVLLPDESGEEDKQGTQHISVTPLDLEQPVHTMYIELGTSLKKLGCQSNIGQ